MKAGVALRGVEKPAEELGDTVVQDYLFKKEIEKGVLYLQHVDKVNEGVADELKEQYRFQKGIEAGRENLRASVAPSDQSQALQSALLRHSIASGVDLKRTGAENDSGIQDHVADDFRFQQELQDRASRRPVDRDHRAPAHSRVCRSALGRTARSRPRPVSPR